MQYPAPAELESFVERLAIPGSYPWRYDLVASQPEIVAFIQKHTGAAHVDLAPNIDRTIEEWDKIPHEISTEGVDNAAAAKLTIRFLRRTINWMREDRASIFGLIVFPMPPDCWTLTARWDNNSGHPRDYETTNVNPTA